MYITCLTTCTYSFVYTFIAALYLYMALFEDGHVSVGVWVGELERCTVSPETFVQHNAVGIEKCIQPLSYYKDI